MQNNPSQGSGRQDIQDDINDQGDSSAFTDGQQQSDDFSQGEGQSSDWGQDQFQQGAQLLILFISRIIESLSVGIPRYMKNWSRDDRDLHAAHRYPHFRFYESDRQVRLEENALPCVFALAPFISARHTFGNEIFCKLGSILLLENLCFYYLRHPIFRSSDDSVEETSQQPLKRPAKSAGLFIMHFD
ncbi:hypothetical protein M1K46_00905 [Fictibacillus sp. WQ 8-8]|uniref:hypothetical protein n=1 Tax=Fictibacillus sp. WQ 8-8 TaxID=2938788 RepID=UPI00210D7237|nr:hypothetical protein [Fictibacillus sp. WQ 8-8]MCQ6264228.1 hypothetical protein [Fictibacillus sp. WQ 8-8]